MILAAVGVAFSTMVGPLGNGEQAVRISRPGGGLVGPPEVVRQVAGAVTVSNGIDVPLNATAGGGEILVVGGDGGSDTEYSGASASMSEQSLGLYTEQLFRAFGYDRDHFGYSYIDWPSSFHRGGGGWRGRGAHGRGDGRQQPAVDPRIEAVLRDLQPIEDRFPVVVGR